MLRHQNAVFGQQFLKFFSTYIWVSSVYGLHLIDIKRDISEALKRCVYAVIDSCLPKNHHYLQAVVCGECPFSFLLAASFSNVPVFISFCQNLFVCRLFLFFCSTFL